MKYLYILIISLTLTNLCTADNIPDSLEQKLDSILTRYIAEENVPSVAIAISIGKDRLYMVKGLSDLNLRTERNPNMQFRIASITKTFIATTILRLVDEGKLAVDDKISRWFPDFPNAENITVDDLLTMRSGIFDSVNEDMLKDFFDDPFIKLNADSMINRAARYSGEFYQPGGDALYTNVNYDMLEKIIEIETGMHIATALNNYIFIPLGLKDTYYPMDTELPGGLHGYSMVGSEMRDMTILNPIPAGGAGAIISSLEDLVIYSEAIAKGRLLKPQTQQRRLIGYPMKGQVSFVEYGEGIVRFGDFIGHNGTIFGFSSEMFYLPEYDASIIINVNRLDLDDQSKSGKLFLILSKYLFPEHVKW